MNLRERLIARYALVAATLWLATFPPSTLAADSVSPDNQWKFRCTDGVWSSIENTASGQMALDLSNELSVPYCGEAEVIWSPDSKRFAFNYSPPHAPHSTYITIAVFELRADKWVALRGLVDEASDVSQLAQLAKEHLARNLRPRTKDLHRDVLKIRQWTDPNTALVYAYARWYGDKSPDRQAAFLFTVKFDNEGNPKIVKTTRLPDKEIEN